MTSAKKDRSDYLRLWHLKNKERRLAAAKQRYQKNREAVILRTTQYRRAHPDLAKKIYSQYRERNRALCRARCRVHYQKNKDKILLQKKSYNRKYYQQHRKERLEATKHFHEKNPHYRAAASQRRRALEAGATINLKEITRWFGSVKAKKSFQCYYCQRRFPTTKVHFDHIVALANGGEHSVRNLCTSCPGCNLSKNDTPLRLWIKAGQQVLEL